MRRPVLDFGFRPHDNSAFTRLIRTARSLQSQDISPRGKIRCRNVVHELLDCDVGIIDISNTSVYDFVQIMRRHVRSHAHCDTTGSIYEEIRDACRHDRWFFERVIKVVHHVDSFLVDILHHRLT